MGIKEELKQSGFKDIYQELAVNLIFTSNWLLINVKKQLAEDGLTLQQFNVLRILRGSLPNPISTTQIRERMLDRMSDVSRIVDRLVKKGLVVKKTCSGDRRLVDVAITQAGLALLKITDTKDDERHNVLENIDPKEAEILSKLLDKARNSSSSNQ